MSQSLPHFAKLVAQQTLRRHIQFDCFSTRLQAAGLDCDTKVSATTVVACFEVGFNSYGLFASAVCKQVGPDSYDY